MGRRARFLIATSATLLGAISAAWWAPQLITPRLLAAAEDLAADQVRGSLSIGAASLSALRDFPQLTLTIDDVSLTGEGDFEGEELLAAQRLEATLELWPALRGEYIVNALAIRGGQVALHIADGGAASWDIFEPVAEPAAETSPLLLDISALELDDVTVAYMDVPAKSTGLVESLSGTGALSLDGDDLLLTLDAASPAVSYTLDGLDYISRGQVALDATLRSDLAQGTYTFAQNRLTINALPVVLDGGIAFIDDGMALDLTFDAPDASFKDLLSAVPAVYARDYADIDASGQIGLRGAVTGRSTATLIPGLELAISVADGRFRYPGLPGEVNDIQVDASISSPEGPTLDDLAIDIRTLSGSLAGQPFAAQLQLTDTQTDPRIDGWAKLDLDLGRLGEFIPLSDDESYAGRVAADVKLRARSSDLSAGRYADVAASGPISLSGFRYDSPDFPHPIEISIADMALIPEGLRIDQLQARTGGSDASVVGQLDDLMGYLFEGAPLKGRFAVKSDRIDMADFSAADTEAPTDEAPSGPVVVPSGYALTVQLDAAEVAYDDIALSSLSGQVDVRDQQATLSDVKAKGFGGTLGIDGTYTARSAQTPRVDFAVAVTALDVPKVASQLDMAGAVTPLVHSARGAFSADLAIRGQLDDAMSPVMNSLSSAGLLSAQQLTFNDTPLFAAVAAATGLPALSDVSVRKLKMRYDLDGGRINVKPTQFQLGELPATVYGSQGLDQGLDYTLELKLPTSSQKVRGLLGDALSAQLPESVPVALAIGGTLTAPKISLSLAATKEELLSGIRDELVDTARSAVSDAAQAVLDEAASRAASILDVARDASDALLAEANQQADALVSAAKGSIAKTLAEKAADALKKEARKRSRQLLNKAEQQAQNIIDKAAAEAAAL